MATEQVVMFGLGGSKVVETVSATRRAAREARRPVTCNDAKWKKHFECSSVRSSQVLKKAFSAARVLFELEVN